MCAQEALLKALSEAGALHLMPSMTHTPLIAHAYLGQPLDGGMLCLLSSLLADGHLRKSLQMSHDGDESSLPASLALHHLCAFLFGHGASLFFSDMRMA